MFLNNFFQWGDKALYYVYDAWFVLVFQCNALKHYSPSLLTKSTVFFPLHLHRLRDFTVQLVSMDSEKPLKMGVVNF